MNCACSVFASRLSFNKLSLSDSGVYVCMAVNRAGSVSSSFTLTVSGSFRLLTSLSSTTVHALLPWALIQPYNRPTNSARKVNSLASLPMRCVARVAVLRWELNDKLYCELPVSFQHICLLRHVTTRPNVELMLDTHKPFTVLPAQIYFIWPSNY